MADLDAQIKQEAEALRNALVIKPIIGQIMRCHLCGAVFSANDLRPFDTHIPRGTKRLACPNCHPERAHG